MLFAHGEEVYMIYFFQEVFNLIIILSFVSINERLFWYIKGIILQCIDIPTTPMGQKKLDWLPILGDHEMHLETREIPFLAGNRASKLLVSIELGVFEADMVTHRNRPTLNHIDAVTIQGLPEMGEKLAHDAEDRLQTMESAMQATLAQHLRHIVMVLEHPASTFKIPAKEASRCKGRCQHLGITHLTLRVFLMMHGV